MSEKLYNLGDLLRARRSFVVFLQDDDKDRVYMDGERWTDVFLLWLAKEEEEKDATK